MPHKSALSKAQGMLERLGFGDALPAQVGKLVLEFTSGRLFRFRVHYLGDQPGPNQIARVVSVDFMTNTNQPGTYTHMYRVNDNDNSWLWYLRVGDDCNCW